MKLSVTNNFVDNLPGDPETKNFRRQVPNACYSLVKPKPAIQPQLIAVAAGLAEELGFSQEFYCSAKFTNIFVGSELPENSRPFAMCYGGHQFGNWAGQLGDGRAINLGDVRDASSQLQALQLKGAGPTPYSRTADGLAVLRSSVREFLCSEAMHALGVPTTRALSVIATGEQVMRDMFYDGNPEYEPGAVVCRVAPSFIRFGNFEIHASRGEEKLLKQLADYTISNFFPEINLNQSDAYLQWFELVAHQTATMIVDWMRVGFVHGVMNTDNMSIHGLTIDYGPYGWLDNFDPDWTPNTTDAEGRRYRYANQPGVAQWNLLQLGNAIFPLVKDAKGLEKVVSDFASIYEQQWLAMMANKIGLTDVPPEDEKLIAELVRVLQITETDMTIFYRRLAEFDVDSFNSDTSLRQFKDSFYSPDAMSDSDAKSISQWLATYSERIKRDKTEQSERMVRMNKANPVYVLRNYLAQEAIDKAHEGDYAVVNELLDLVQKPYDIQDGKERFAQKRPDWARRKPGCSMLSCSS